MKNVPAEWTCKAKQQHAREEYQKQIDIKLCKDRQKKIKNYVGYVPSINNQ